MYKQFQIQATNYRSETELDLSEGYNALRRSAVVYPRARHIVEVSGPGRQALLSYVLARPTEYAQPGTALESLVLSENGVPVDMVLAVFDEMRAVLLSDVEHSVLTKLDAIAESRRIQDVGIARMHDWSAAQVEGPAAWRAVSPFLKEDIAGVLLNEWRAVTITPSPDSAILVRTGTSAEYGYLLIARASSAQLTDWLAVQSAGWGGERCSEAALLRARVEVNHPVIGAQFDGVSVVEAGGGWLGGLGRQDAYRGKPDEEPSRPRRRLLAVQSVHDLPPRGSAVLAGEKQVGSIHLVAPRVGQPTSLGLALLDAPFDVPGLEMRTEAGLLVTVSRPAVEPASWVEGIG